MPRLRCLFALVSTASLAATSVAVAAGQSSPPRLRVTPRSGHVRTTFVVHFKAPAPAAVSGDTERSYSLTAKAGHPHSGCLGSMTVSPRPSHEGQAMSVRLNPARLRWCTGGYGGQVVEVIRPMCGPPGDGESSGIACPMYIAVVRIGTFAFSVRH